MARMRMTVFTSKRLPLVSKHTNGVFHESGRMKKFFSAVYTKLKKGSEERELLGFVSKGPQSC